MDELEILLPPPENEFARILRALGRSVLLTLAAALVLLAGALAYDKIVNRSAAPSAFRHSALVVATGSWCCTKHGEALSCELARLWPRLRHGQRREALGRGEKWS